MRKIHTYSPVPENGTFTNTTAVITNSGTKEYRIIDLNLPRLLLDRSIRLPTTGSATADTILATKIKMATTDTLAPKMEPSNSAW